MTEKNAPEVDDAISPVDYAESESETDKPVDENETDTVDAEPVDADQKPSTENDRTRRFRGAGSKVALIAAAVALAASAGLAAWLYFAQFKPDQETNADATNVALDAAKSGTVALLSYSPDTLDKDFTAAKSRLTGDFLAYYTQFTQEIVTPAAQQKQVKTNATVVQAAIAEITPESASALLFVNQTTTSKENPAGVFAASSVKVGLTKVDGNWLISTFDPV